MRKELFLVLLVFIIFLAGCAQQQICKNDVITIEDYNILTKTPYSGGRTSIDFLISNNGGEEVSKVEVDFFDTSAFEVLDLKCELGSREGKKCVFNNLEYQDVRDISLRLKAPTVKDKTPYTVSFSISYSNSGEREMGMPIVDGEIKKKPTMKYYISSPSCDPIRLDFEKEIKPEETEREYWTTVDKPFEIKFRFTHVGTVEGVKTINLTKGSVKLKLTNLQIQEPCDFDSSLVLKKSITVPGDISCNFLPISSKQLEYVGVINVKYDYDYEYVKSETFTVYPK